MLNLVIDNPSQVIQIEIQIENTFNDFDQNANKLELEIISDDTISVGNDNKDRENDDREDENLIKNEKDIAKVAKGIEEDNNILNSNNVNKRVAVKNRVDKY